MTRSALQMLRTYSMSLFPGPPYQCSWDPKLEDRKNLQYQLIVVSGMAVFAGWHV